MTRLFKSYTNRTALFMFGYIIDTNAVVWSPITTGDIVHGIGALKDL